MSEHQVDAGEPLGLQDRAQWRGVLRTPFRNLFYANVTSSLGDWIGVAAILALTEQILGGATRGTAFALSGIMIARILPTMLLGPVAGVYVDRWDRRRLLIGTDIGRGIIMALVPFSPDIYALFLATLAIEVMSTLFLPAKDAVVPALVSRDQLVQANQLNLIAAYGTLPVGGALFALFTGASLTTLGDRWTLIAERPAAVPIWINALSFFVSAVFVMRIRGLNSLERERTTAAAVDRPGAWQELKQGLQFITRHPLVRGLVTGVMGAFLAAGAVIAVGQLFAVIVNASDVGFGVLIAVVGFGLFAGILSVGPLSSRLAKEQLFAPGIGTAGVALMVAAFMPRLDLATIPVFIMGYGGGLAFLAGYTILQERTSDAVRGRTFAAFNTGIRAALFASLVIVPLVVGVIGPEAQGLVADAGGGVGEGPIEPGQLSGPVPYSIGGIRISLVLAGAVALMGAVYSGRSIHQVLSIDESRELSLGEGPGPAARPPRGLFVTFEGGDGAGKSTQVRLLRAAVERAGHDATVTREPGGTDVGERIRNLVLDPEVHGMADRTEALLYAAARAQHVEEVIRPALEKGHVVLSDRFVDSSVVYQGIGRELGEAAVAELNRWATAELQPDLVVVLDVDPVVGLRRVGDETDRLEGAGLEFHRTVNRAFRNRGILDPERYLVLDASQPAERLHAQVRDAVLGRLDGDGDGDDQDDMPPPPPPAAAAPAPLPEEPPLGGPDDLRATDAISPADRRDLGDTVALPPDDPNHPGDLGGTA